MKKCVAIIIIKNLKDIKRNFQFCNFSPYGGSPAGRQLTTGNNETKQLDNASLKYLETEMKKAAKEMDFERAAELRDKILRYTQDK